MVGMPDEGRSSSCEREGMAQGVMDSAVASAMFFYEFILFYVNGGQEVRVC